MNVREQIQLGINVAKRQQMLAQDYAETFEESDAGKRVLQDILDKCGILETIEPPATADERSEHAGRRAVGIFIISRLRYSAGQLAELARRQTAAALAAGAEMEGA